MFPYNQYQPPAGQQFGQAANQNMYPQGYQRLYPLEYPTNPNIAPQQQFQQPQPSPIGLKGRTVGSVDEVRAAQIDLDGSKTYFPCPSTQQVFVKYIGMDGNAVVEIYSKAEPATPKQYAESAALSQLESRIAALETMLNKGAQA